MAYISNNYMNFSIFFNLALIVRNLIIKVALLVPTIIVRTYTVTTLTMSRAKLESHMM